MAAKKRKTITFSQLRRLQMVSKTKGLYQMRDNRFRDVGIGMVDEGPADGTETLVTEDDGSLPDLTKKPRKRRR